jgi:integrase
MHRVLKRRLLKSKRESRNTTAELVTIVILARHGIHSSTRCEPIHGRSTTPSMGWTVVSQILVVRLLSYDVTCDLNARAIMLPWLAKFLAAYTGARRGDIFNLKISSVRHDTDCERFFLFIEEGKADVARRKIPLNSKLIELGFLGFDQSKESGSVPEDRLFREFKSDQYVTLKFRESLDYLDVPRANDALRRYAFHSLRHAVITEAAKHNNMQLVQRVVGHEITGVGITKLYTGEFELKDVLNVIDCLDW